TVAMGAVLDFETTPTFSLFAHVTDGTNSVAAPVTVNLTFVPTRGDLDGDDILTAGDISRLMIALSNLAAYQQDRHLSDDDLMTIVDVNKDQAKNNLDIQALICMVANSASLGTGGARNGMANAANSTGLGGAVDSTNSSKASPPSDPARSIVAPTLPTLSN